MKVDSRDLEAKFTWLDLQLSLVSSLNFNKSLVIYIYILYCRICIVQIVQNNSSFGRRAITALGVSIIADGLDYFAAPLSSSPIIGDIFDSIVASMLYSITKSKLATAINLIEFIPFVGDFIPVYTLSTLYWISR